MRQNDGAITKGSNCYRFPEAARFRAALGCVCKCLGLAIALRWPAALNK